MKARQVILAIEDDPEDYRLLDRIVSSTSDLQIFQAKTLAQAKADIADKSVELILLDLTLPDSKGVDAITTLTAICSSPVVVLTGLDNEELAYNAVQLGAQDYLVKGTFDSTLLLKTIRYAIERYRLIHELHESKLAIQREQEQRRLQTSIPSPIPTVTANSYGQYSLRESSPDTFNQFVGHYKSILEGAIEQRAFKVDNDIPKKLRTMATHLGKQRVMPRDVVELHTVTLATMTKNASAGKSEAYSEEARYQLIGILGHLCTFYRSYCYSLLPSPSKDTDGPDVERSGNPSI